ncbi:MAG: fluoride efflux transporter CrcB [Sulfurovaceae bacterium]|nr:fluoride efflux transporter CrcB [Sulfurovaceae bacterium]MDD5548773.1 fluoride efflux transporter CrcB [Sulfurovaceae bacterium]
MNLGLIIAVGSGGALGAIARMLVNGFASKNFSNYLPYGTIMVNLSGSLIIGMLFAYFHHHPTLPPNIKSFLVTGFLGALTTYSTFAIESFFLLESGKFLQAFSNIAINLIGTIALSALGYLLVVQLYKVN